MSDQPSLEPRLSEKDPSYYEYYYKNFIKYMVNAIVEEMVLGAPPLGTKEAEESLKILADLYFYGNKPWDKPVAVVGAGLVSFWTEETWGITAGLLVGGGTYSILMRESVTVRNAIIATIIRLSTGQQPETNLPKVTPPPIVRPYIR